MKNKLVLLILIVIIAVAGINGAIVSEASASDYYQLIVDGQVYAFPENVSQPVLLNDRIYVPLRMVMETLDCQVEWLAATRQIYIVSAGKEMSFHVTNDTYSEDGVQIIINDRVLVQDENIGIAFINEENSTMVPLRSVSTGLGCDVLWQDNVVIITQEKRPTISSREDEPTHEIADTTNIYDLTIFGENTATAEQIYAFLDDMKPMLVAKAGKNGTIYREIPDNIVELYLSIGEKYGIRGDVALAQAIKETGYFQYGGIVEYWQNNFCGLGATGIAYTAEDQVKGVDTNKVWIIPNTHGLTFATVEYGVEAHIQHLYSYATDASLPNGIERIDPRFSHGYRGIATKWTDLNGRWAVPGNGYGESIIDDYWVKMLSY